MVLLVAVALVFAHYGKTNDEDFMDISGQYQPSMEKQNTKVTFIFLSQMNNWGLFKRRNEALLLELSQRDSVERVLHIEPFSAKGFVGLIVRWWRSPDDNIKQVFRLHFRKALSLKPVLADGGGKIYVYSIFVLYAGNFALFKKLSNFLIRVQGGFINKSFVRSKKNVVLVAYPPSYYLPAAINAIKHDILIADLVDDVIARAKNEVIKNTFINNYKSVLSHCNWIFANSPVVSDAYRDYTKQEIEFLPNGVDCNEYSKDSPCKLLKKDGRKVAGYVGNFFWVIDFDLLEYIVSCCPQVDFVLIGPTDKERFNHINNIASRYNNCHYLGARKFTEVPDYMAGFDVLISFKKADYKTRGNDSMKIYQYLATGKPIVTTPVSPADRFADLIYVASDKFEFVKYLKQALEENDPEISRKRINVALENTWSKRADVILDRVSNFFGERI